MANLDYDFFFKELEAGVSTDETCFYFTDDPTEAEHFLGFLPQHEKPYWVGYCDIPDGTAFSSAEELIHAEIFEGKSLRSRWDKVFIVSIEGVDLEGWLEYFIHEKQS